MIVVQLFKHVTTHSPYTGATVLQKVKGYEKITLGHEAYTLQNFSRE